MAASLVWKLRRTGGRVSLEPFQPVSGSGRSGSCRSNSSSQRPVLALPDWVVLRSSSEMRAIVIVARRGKVRPVNQGGFMCGAVLVVLNRPSFLSDEGGAHDIQGFTHSAVRQRDR